MKEKLTTQRCEAFSERMGRMFASFMSEVITVLMFLILTIVHHEEDVF